MSLYPYGLPSVAADCHAPADNTAAVVTYGATAGKKHYLFEVYWGFDADPTTPVSLTITDAGALVFNGPPITKSGPGFYHFDPPLVSSAASTAMVVTLPAGGAAVQGVLSCRHEVK